MRTNVHGITENAEFKIDKEKFDEGMDRIFGPPPKQFCDSCDKRLSFCDCPKEEPCSVPTEF